MTNAPELTLDYENSKLDKLDRYGRPRTNAFQANEGYLFFNYIYSILYDTTPKQYLTLFAVTRDFFYSFFGIIKNDLN